MLPFLSVSPCSSYFSHLTKAMRILKDALPLRLASQFYFLEDCIAVRFHLFLNVESEQNGVPSWGGIIQNLSQVVGVRAHQKVLQFFGSGSVNISHHVCEMYSGLEIILKICIVSSMKFLLHLLHLEEL